MSIADLRAQIRALEGGPRVERARVPSGSPALDGLVGGLPRPGLFELHGPPGCGAVRLALQMVADETRRRRWVAWVDRERTLHPPAALAIGVDLDRMLIVQPPAGGAEGGRHAGTWAVEQLLRSGCFPLVVVTSDPAMPEHRFAGTRWRQAAEKGNSTALILTRDRNAGRALQPDVRLLVEPGRLTVTRDRAGQAGAIAMLPPVGTHIDPWEPGVP
ncbi:MAG: hypothetical protein H6737_08510 [Alphaproteobacteria bacterium]|nr:hypothetical protein [Alphaproteobacteria bacterium]